MADLSHSEDNLNAENSFQENWRKFCELLAANPSLKERIKSELPYEKVEKFSLIIEGLQNNQPLETNETIITVLTFLNNESIHILQEKKEFLIKCVLFAVLIGGLILLTILGGVFTMAGIIAAGGLFSASHFKRPFPDGYENVISNLRHNMQTNVVDPLVRELEDAEQVWEGMKKASATFAEFDNSEIQHAEPVDDQYNLAC